MQVKGKKLSENSNWHLQWKHVGKVAVGEVCIVIIFLLWYTGCWESKLCLECKKEKHCIIAWFIIHSHHSSHSHTNPFISSWLSTWWPARNLSSTRRGVSHLMLSQGCKWNGPFVSGCIRWFDFDFEHKIECSWIIVMKHTQKKKMLALSIPHPLLCMHTPPFKCFTINTSGHEF